MDGPGPVATAEPSPGRNGTLTREAPKSAGKGGDRRRFRAVQFPSPLMADPLCR